VTVGKKSGCMHDLTLERIAENQSTFRNANERIEAAADDMALTDRLPFICECPDRTCMQLVRLTLGEYEEVRREPTWFLTAPGHEALAVEAGAGVIVTRHDGYVLVEKVGEAGEVAEELSERAIDG
jgi:hypothetical protein